MPIGIIDQPIDYRDLWFSLVQKITRLKTDEALRCATEKTLEKVPLHQGAFAFADIVLGTMESMVAAAKTGAQNGRYAVEDDDR